MSKCTMSTFIYPELMWNKMGLKDYALESGRPPGGGKVGTDLERRREAQTRRRDGEGTPGRGSTRHERMGGLGGYPGDKEDIRLKRLRP